MWTLVILTLATGAVVNHARSYPEDDDEGEKFSRLRQTIYNFRPQSTILDEENEYRSYDNNFGPRGAPTEGPGARGFGGNYRAPRRPPPPSRHPPPRPIFQDDDDYPTGPNLPDDDDIELEPIQPNSPYGFNTFRQPSSRPRPVPIIPSVPRRYWDDQSGRERGDPSYSFGYELDDQSRRENSDVFGNVNGDFSFVDDEGTYRKVTYSSGAHKGFVVNSKTPPESPLPSPPRRIKKPPVLLHPSRVPRPGSGWEPQKQTNTNNNHHVDTNSDAGAGIGINVVKGTHAVPASPPPRPVAHRPKEGWNSQGGHHHGANQAGSKPLPAATDDGNGAPGDEATPAWGALVPNSKPARQRPMRKRKPALVVKVRRPVSGNHQGQVPAWMYYRPPNNRPLQQAASGWTSRKPAVLQQPDEDCDPGTAWSEDENDVADPYPADKSYSFGYNAGDQTRQEVSDAYGNIRGSYSYVDPTGVQRTVHYTAGHSGFKVLSAQPSVVRPVYADAPRVSSIPIPLPVMSHLTQLSNHLAGPVPQASAIVYHIHPDNGVGADWRPWESSRMSKSRYRHRRPHHRRSSKYHSSGNHQQQNLFHLTHENENFYPSYSRIESENLETTMSPDVEILPAIPDNQIFVKELKQQIRRSQKLKKLQQEFQEPILEYTSKHFPPRSSQNRLGFTTDTLDLSPIVPDDQLFSDYEQTDTKPTTHNSNNKRRQGRREMIKKSRSSSTSSSSSSKSNNDTEEKIIQTTSEPATTMGIEGEHEIQAYNGGYGDKNPLLVISEMPQSKERSSRSRLQRKTLDDDVPTSIERSISAVPDSLASESAVVTSSSSITVKSEEVSNASGRSQSKERAYVSPAALLSAKMSSANPSRVSSTSTTSMPAIRMSERGGQIMHFPERKLEASKESHVVRYRN